MSVRGDRLTLNWVESMSRFHWMSGGGDPVAWHTASTLLPCISVTVLGDTVTLGTTRRYKPQGDAGA